MIEPGGDVVGGLYLLLGISKRGNEARLSTTAFTLRKRTVPCRTEPSWPATLCRAGSVQYGMRLHRENFRAVSCRIVPYRERELV